MIRRESEKSWVLISQVDHAVISAEVAAAWGNDAVHALPLRNELLRAIRLHDDGWPSWEAWPSVDPKTGVPRDFTEMPMAEAAAIWSRSIDVAARGQVSYADVAERLHDIAPEQLSPFDHRVLEAALGFDSRFSLDELHHVMEPDCGVEDVSATLDQLCDLGFVERSRSSPLGRDRVFEVTSARHDQNPFGGSWVSGHFARLAEQAIGNRHDPGDRLAAERFVAEQARRREMWRPALEAYAGDDADRLASGGCRLLRFFDWISLWICCAERTDGGDMELPGGPVIRFDPDGVDRFRVSPWPLDVSELHLEVPALRLPAEPLPDDDAFHTALEDAERIRLEWQLVPN